MICVLFIKTSFSTVMSLWKTQCKSTHNQACQIKTGGAACCIQTITFNTSISQMRTSVSVLLALQIYCSISAKEVFFYNTKCHLIIWLVCEWWVQISVSMLCSLKDEYVQLIEHLHFQIWNILSECNPNPNVQLFKSLMACSPVFPQFDQTGLNLQF